MTLRSMSRHWPTLLLLSSVSLPQPAGASSVAPMSIDQTAGRASAIFLGTVEREQARWANPERQWIVTDVTVRVEEVIQPHARVRKAGQQVVLPFWGGVMGDRVQTVADLQRPRTGERCVFMLRPGWEKRRSFSPMVGFNHGLFHAEQSARRETREPVMLDAAGCPLARRSDGGFERGDPQGAEAAAAGPVTLPDFCRWLRIHLPRLRATPWNGAGGPTVQPTQQPRSDGPGSFRIQATDDPAPSGTELVFPNSGGVAAAAPSLPQRTISEAATVIENRGGARSPRAFKTFGWREAPVVVYPLPSDAFGAPQDQQAMSWWNQYADVFRVPKRVSGRYAAGNGRSEILGFYSDEQMQRTFGAGWDDGTLAVTYSWGERGSDRLTESDIVFNPQWDWTLEQEPIWTGTESMSFLTTMIHELGHVLGLDHEWNQLSLMNYAPATFRAYPFPFRDDAAAIRSLYESESVSTRDLGITLFRATGRQRWSDARLSRRIAAGGRVAIQGYTLANLGTERVEEPKIDWYLTENLNYKNARHLGATTHPALDSDEEVVAESSIPIPADTPPGEYYLLAFIHDDPSPNLKQFPFNNNSGWSAQKIEVTR